MAIEDPTAIPETVERLAEYMQEADRLWNDSRTEDASVLYRSVFNCTMSNDYSSLAGYRLALYLQSIGDLDGALNFVAYTNEPGTRDLEIALRAAMPDQPVDPSEVPETAEACERYMTSIVNAVAGTDWTTVDALVLAYQQTSVDIGVGRHATAQAYRGIALVHLGRHDEARPCLEWAVANSNNEDRLKEVRAALQQIGIQVDDQGNPYETHDSQSLLIGIGAFESGDLHAAATQLKSVVDSNDAGAQDKGRAHFYLGSMAYHDRRFEEARGHLHIAQNDAPNPEQEWAVDMLSWRWQEE